MPYALFEKEYRLSRTFPTATDAWRCVEDYGLIAMGPTVGNGSTMATRSGPALPMAQKLRNRRRTG